MSSQTSKKSGFSFSLCDMLTPEMEEQVSDASNDSSVSRLARTQGHTALFYIVFYWTLKDHAAQWQDVRRMSFIPFIPRPRHPPLWIKYSKLRHWHPQEILSWAAFCFLMECLIHSVMPWIWANARCNIPSFNLLKFVIFCSLNY